MSYHQYGQSSGGSPFWLDAVDTSTNLPLVGIAGAVVYVIDTQTFYSWTGSVWVAFISPTIAVAGPASATDNAVCRFDQTTGKLIQNSTVTIDDAGSINIPTGQKYKINNVDLAPTDIGAEPVITTKNTAFNKNYGTTATDVKINGVQSVGVIDEVARIDHVHPVDTSRQPAGSYELSTNKGIANGYASLDANTLIPITQIPPAALERLIIVADQAARYALTTATVQNGDTVKQTDTNEMFFVKDDTNLGNANGYAVYNAGTASSVAWSGITSKPTTLAGYGITDATGKVFPTTNQRVFVNYLSGSDVTGDGSYDKPFKSVQAALASITDASQTKPYTIFLGANRQIETGDVFLKPYCFIVGDVQRSTYFRVNSGQLKPSTDHATSSSWCGLANLYFGGSSVLNWDLQALGGSNSTFVIQNCTLSGQTIFKGRNSGGGDFLEVYVGLELSTLSMDSFNHQIQSIEIGGNVSITNTQGVSGLSGTFRNVCFDGNVSIDATGGAITTYMEQNNFCGLSNTLTTTGTVTIQTDDNSLPPTSRQTLSVGTTLNLINDISNAKFTPTTPANWASTPSKVQTALDAVALASNTSSSTKTGVLSSTDWTTFNTKLTYSSSGCLTPPTYTDNGSGNITINSHDVSLFDSTSFSGPPKKYTLSGITVTLTDQTTNYVIADYNSGSPIMRVTTDVSEINESTITPMLTIYRGGTTLHTLNWDSLSLGLPNKIHQSIVKTQRYRRESGLALSETGTRNISITGGVVWVGANKITIDSTLSSTDNIRFYSHVAGVWTLSLVTQYNNTQYDDGTDLVTLTNNRYAVNWVYRGVESQKHIYVVLGTGDYTLTSAQTSQPPTLPAAISSHSVLVGRIIVLKGSSTATQIDSAFDISFATAAVSNHNDLSGIQGGTTSEYYHLTSAQATIATQAASASVSGYLTSTDWSTFNAKMSQPTISAKSSSFTAANGFTYILDTSTNNIAIQLPTPSSGLRFEVKDKSFNALAKSVTLVRAASEKIENVAATYTLNSDGFAVTVVSDGTDWFLI